MRLDKFICDNTDLTRTDAKKAIREHRVLINDNIAKSASIKLENDDQIQLDGKLIQALSLRYFILNKPKGYVCSTQDPDHPIVLSLLQEPQRQKLHIAGRLDKDTTGLVLITDDGQWSHRVTSPRSECIKRYRVSLDQPLSETAQQQLQHGVALKNEPKPTRPAQVEQLSETEIYLAISEGKYHQVKRMLAAVGNHVNELHRDRVGGICLDDSLAEGCYRSLTPEEIALF
ncbi:MAG: 16S rRNA pseudouridine(516) synthase RsuA [Pseudomonadales bacterium]|nr:16S rRNA pseudouridine(516) synthase RsuA [Pseudomonadales bacterium]